SARGGTATSPSCAASPSGDWACGRASGPSYDAARLLLATRRGFGFLVDEEETAVVAFLELHAGPQSVLVEQVRDLLQGLLAEVLDVHHLVLGALHEISEGLDVLLLQGVPRPHRELRDVVDGALEQVLQALGHGHGAGGRNLRRAALP